MSLAGIFKGRGPNGFGYGTTAMEVVAGCDLAGRTMLVTGCSSGLGLETIRALAARGARIIAAARTVDKARAACQGDGMAGDFLPVACELSEPASIRACIDAVKSGAGPLDAIVCNAGVMAPPTLRQAHGYELQFFTNHIGHFILVTDCSIGSRPPGGSWSSRATPTAAPRRASSSTTSPARAATRRCAPTGSRSSPTSVHA